MITGHTKKGEADALANIHKQEGTSVFLMGLSNLEPIMQRLREEGESEETPVSVISNGMLPGETIVLRYGRDDRQTCFEERACFTGNHSRRADSCLHDEGQEAQCD